jgi:hypothetical protein
MFGSPGVTSWTVGVLLTDDGLSTPNGRAGREQQLR